MQFKYYYIMATGIELMASVNIMNLCILGFGGQVTALETYEKDK